MNLKNLIFLLIGFILLLSIPVEVFAQSKKNIIEKGVCNRIFNFEFRYTYQIPQGYLASNFGPLHNIGFGGIIKTKDNWLYGLHGAYQFGNEVTSDLSQSILGNLTNSTGTISSNSGSPGMVILGERGFNAFLTGGKLINVNKKNLNSGFAFILGVGYLTHKLNITTPQSNVPAFSEDLKKGYDRLTMGIAFTQTIGYYFQGENRMTNFYLGIDFMEGFTTNTRGFNYDTRLSDNGNHLDIFIGPKLCWMIPIYLASKGTDEFIYR
jgi:hypothetical protein